MKDGATLETIRRNTAGWTNYCATCQRRGATDERARYWVRSIDQAATRVRRYVGEESSELHECVEVLQR